MERKRRDHTRRIKRAGSSQRRSQEADFAFADFFEHDLNEIGGKKACARLFPLNKCNHGLALSTSDDSPIAGRERARDRRNGDIEGANELELIWRQSCHTGD